jgi:hypothetical protein
MSNINLKYNGFDLEIKFSISQDDKSTGFRGGFEEISEIIHKGEDLTYLLEPQFDDIQNAIEKELKARNEDRD